MGAQIKLLAACLLFAVNACAGESVQSKLIELRALPEGERTGAFRQLDETTKVELFFEATRRHPPYAGLNDAFAIEGGPFMLRVRDELDARGGVPEVLAFLGVVLDMKNHGGLSSNEIRALRVRGICQLAKASEYCPEVEEELLKSP